ncbi:MAG: hypothetical protein R3F13_19155 [Prosthecobacter sp.]
MKRLLLLLALLAPPASAADAELLIHLGLGDTEPTVWDGSVSVSPGEVRDVTGYRFEQKDALTGKTSWKASTRTPQGAVKPRGNNPRKLGAARQLGPIFENGVFVKLQDVTPESVIELDTAPGKVSFKLSDLTQGETLRLMDGRVAVQETAFTLRRVSPERTEDDFPALAAGASGAFLIYQSFTPGIDRDERARQLTAEPEDFAYLATPAGGDQLWLHARKGNVWTEERIPVTETGRDIYKSSVTLDGKDGAWIVWSERVDGHFDILARHYSGGALGAVETLSPSKGNDLCPVAATGADGTVMVAWMAGKDGVFAIDTRTLKDGQWGETKTISNNAGNCWNPAIAAHGDKFAVAWDTYAKGDYDVWMCFSDGEPMPIATSADYEARAAVTFDHEGALWVAFEKSGPTWGKDWGAYDGGDGIGLYKNREIGLVVVKNGELMEPVGKVADALPGATARGPRQGKGKKKATADEQAPAPPKKSERPTASPSCSQRRAKARPARMRKPPDHADLAISVTCSAARTGASGSSTRTRLNSFRGILGSTWGSWRLPRRRRVGGADHHSTQRQPALQPARRGRGPKNVFIAHSSDHRMDRMAEFNRAKTPGGKGGNASLDATKDPFDNDVYFSRIHAQGEVQPAALQPLADKPAADTATSKRTQAERDEVTTIRNYRAKVDGTELRILRGEFHRHTEISGDGGGDGPLEDMWRYAIDAASMDWLGNGDHDNGNGREYTWWLTQKTTDAFMLPGAFTPMFSYERSVSYPEGHRNVVFAQRGVRTLPRLPISDPRVHEPAPDTNMLYKYLRHFGGVCASHTSVGRMGTDWRNWGGDVEPMVEIYQGARQNYEYPGCPRCPTEDDAIGGWEPGGWICDAFAKGYKFSFQSSSDHGSTHISYAMVYTEDTTREGILKAMKQRHTYGATDNIVADSRCTAADGKERMMGDEFSVNGAPTITLKLTGTMPFEKVTMIKDNVEFPIDAPKEKDISITWTDPKPEKGKTSYYYFRGEQTNGELVWVSPMWITLE